MTVYFNLNLSLVPSNPNLQYLYIHIYIFIIRSDRLDKYAPKGQFLSMDEPWGFGLPTCGTLIFFWRREVTSVCFLAPSCTFIQGFLEILVLGRVLMLSINAKRFFVAIGPCRIGSEILKLVSPGNYWASLKKSDLKHLSLRYEAWSSATASLLRVFKSVAEWFLVPYVYFWYIYILVLRFMNSNFGFWLVIKIELQTWSSSQTFTGPRFQPPQMVARADTVGTQKGTLWNAWSKGENGALRQVWSMNPNAQDFCLQIVRIDFDLRRDARFLLFFRQLIGWLLFWIDCYIFFVARSRDIIPKMLSRGIISQTWFVEEWLMSWTYVSPEMTLQSFLQFWFSTANGHTFFWRPFVSSFVFASSQVVGGEKKHGCFP